MAPKRRRAPKQQRRNLADPNDRLWTIDQAAAHYGYRRETILRYIREGLPLYGTVIDREELLAEVGRRTVRQKATRAKTRGMTGL